MAELLGENERTGREAYPQTAGRPVKTSARVRLGMAVSEASEMPRRQHLRRQQIEWVEADCFGVAFDGGQGEVALATFDTADVGAVHADQLGESFLGEPFGLAVGAEILADDALQVSDCHVPKAHGMLLENLQTYT